MLGGFITLMHKLVNEVKYLMDKGFYEPDVLFSLIYPQSRKHYSTVRNAIHIAKTRIYA